MIDLLAILAACLTIKEVVKEKMEPVAPKGTRFDWDAYQKDIENGIGAMEQVRKRQSGGYMTTAPLPTPPASPAAINDVVDIKRYQYDKRVYGEAFAEVNRKNGSYKYIIKRERYE